MKNDGLSGVMTVILGLIAFAAVGLAISMPCTAAELGDEQELIEKAHETFNNFQSGSDMKWYRDLLRDAEGILIVPEMFRAGFLLGGSGGKGVLFVRDKETGRWSGPAFYNLGSFSGGLQIGAQVAEVALLAMSREGVEALYSPSVKLGTDVSIAVGPSGSGAAGAVAPNPKASFLSFMRAKGAYAGLTLEGAVIDVDEDANSAYYGKTVRPIDILEKHTVSSRGAAALRSAIAGAAARPVE